MKFFIFPQRSVFNHLFTSGIPDLFLHLVFRIFIIVTFSESMYLIIDILLQFYTLSLCSWRGNYIYGYSFIEKCLYKSMFARFSLYYTYKVICNRIIAHFYERRSIYSLNILLLPYVITKLIFK